MSAGATLAINGGTPLRSVPMPPRLALGPDEERMVAECLAWYRDRAEDPGYQGEFERRYCEAFAASLGGGHADSVATGTLAIFVAIAALNLPKGSEVLCSPITDPGTLSAIIMNGLKPRLMDSAPGSYNVGPQQFLDRVTDQVSAAVVVHSLGHAAEIDAIVAEAHARGIRVVEDCSQAHGAKWKGRPVGTFGDIAAFSTMYRKAHMTGASGGVVFTRDVELYHMALAHGDRGKPRWIEGFDDRDPNHFLFPALNLHTDEISCAIGLASLGRLPQVIMRRLAFVAEFTGRLRAKSKVCRPYGYQTSDSPFVTPVMVDASRLTVSKTRFAEAVRAEGIGLNPHYQYVVADWPFLKPYLADDFGTPNARAARDGSFCLYLNEKYSEREAADCVAAILKVEAELAR